MSKISFRNIYKTFEAVPVLKNFSLNIKHAENFVILGGSGTGKSVLLKCLLGLLEPDDGQIFIDEIDVVAADAKRRKSINANIGMLFQNGALFDSLTVFENVAFGLLSGRNASFKENTAIVYQCLEHVGLERSVAKKFPSDLSGGMRKRVGLARVIAASPRIMLFDEPTTGLDPISGTAIDMLILSSVKDLRTTAITITHNIQSARHIADRIGLLYDGRIVWEGTAKEMDHTKNPYIRQFVSGNSSGPIPWAQKTNVKLNNKILQDPLPKTR